MWRCCKTKRARRKRRSRRKNQPTNWLIRASPEILRNHSVHLQIERRKKEAAFGRLFLMMPVTGSVRRVGADAHRVERAVDEGEGNHEKDGGRNVRQAAALCGRQLHPKFCGQHAEKL